MQIETKGFPVIPENIKKEVVDGLFYTDLDQVLDQYKNENGESHIEWVVNPSNKAEEVLLKAPRSRLLRINDTDYLTFQTDHHGRSLMYLVDGNKGKPIMFSGNENRLMSEFGFSAKEPSFKVKQILVQIPGQEKIADLHKLCPTESIIYYNPVAQRNKFDRNLVKVGGDSHLGPMLYEEGDPRWGLAIGREDRQIDLILHEIGHMWDLRGEGLLKDAAKELSLLASASNLKDWWAYKAMFGWNIGPLIQSLYSRTVGAEATKDYKTLRERNPTAIALLLKRFLKKQDFDIDMNKTAKEVAGVYQIDLAEYDRLFSMLNAVASFASSWYKKRMLADQAPLASLNKSTYRPVVDIAYDQKKKLPYEGDGRSPYNPQNVTRHPLDKEPEQQVKKL